MCDNGALLASLLLRNPAHEIQQISGQLVHFSSPDQFNPSIVEGLPPLDSYSGILSLHGQSIQVPWEPI